jgi:hypothetical protein
MKETSLISILQEVKNLIHQVQEQALQILRDVQEEILLIISGAVSLNY